MTTLINPYRFGGYATPALVQSNYNLAASGPATATISAATAGNLLIAAVSGATTTPAIAGSGWTSIGSVTTGAARCILYVKVAAGGESSEATTGAGVNESIMLAEFSGATATLSGTAQTGPDSGVGVNSLALAATTPTVPALIVAFVATSGTLTAPAWSSVALTNISGSRIQFGYLAVVAGSYGSTLTFTGSARRASGVLAAFAAKTL